MRYLLALFTLIAVAIGVLIIIDTVRAQIVIETPSFSQKPNQTTSVADSATTTKSVPTMYTHNFDSEYLVQGVCLRIKDSDGVGYTYLSVNDGTGTFSSISCE